MSVSPVTPAMVAALRSDTPRLFHLVRVAMDTGTVYFTDAYREVTWDGHAWTAFGHFLGFDSVETTDTMAPGETQVLLSAVDQSLVALFGQEQYLNRRMTLWLGAFDDAFAVIDSPFMLRQGGMDKPTIEVDPAAGTATIAVAMANGWQDFKRKVGRITNNAVQQAMFPGDRFFEYAHQITGQMWWGARPSSQGITVTPYHKGRPLR